MAWIAQVSVNTVLARSGELLLERAGYTVRTFHAVHALVSGCKKLEFNALIVGHQMNDGDRKKVYSAFREYNPGAPIIQVVTSDDRVSDCECVLFNLYDGPEALLALLDSTLANTQSRFGAD